MKKKFIFPSKLPSGTALKTLEQEAVTWLEYQDQAYHEKSAPRVSDAEYDRVKDQFRLIFPNNDYLKQVGAAITFGTKAELPSPMGSLHKLRPSGIKDWIDSLGEQDDIQGEQYWLVLPKLDGISGELVYKNGKLQAAYTRGDGSIGRVITPNAVYVQGVLPQYKAMSHKLYTHLNKGTIVVKGEFIVHKSIFDAHYSTKTTKSKESYANPRNFVGGMLNRVPRNGQVDASTKKNLSDCTFVAFSVSRLYKGKEIRPDLKTQELLALMMMGFTTITNPQRYSEGHNSIQRKLSKGILPPSLKEYLPIFGEPVGLRSIFKYEDMTEDLMREMIGENSKLIDIGQDGLVIQPMHTNWGVKAHGFGGNYPEWIRAVKLDTSEQNSQVGIVKSVEWRVTRRRLLKPRIEFKEALNFEGVDVTFCTGFNAKFIKDNDIRNGTKVRLIRSGDVIPRIVAVKQGKIWKKVD